MPCDTLLHTLEGAGLVLPRVLWKDDGPNHCNATFSAAPHAEAGGGATPPIAWDLQLRVSKDVLLQELQQHVHATARSNATGGGGGVDTIHLTNVLCMPRVMLLWAWLRHSSAASSAARFVRHIALLLRPVVPPTPADAAEAGAAAPAAAHQAQPSAREQLEALQRVQWLLQGASPRPGGPQPGQPKALWAERGVAQLVPPPPWSVVTWAAAAVAPGLLVAQRAIAVCSDQPGCVLCLCAFGMLRTGFEGYALHQVLNNRRLRSADKVDSAICSHVLPAALTALFSGLQVLMAPLMPHAMREAVSWMCLLLLPPISMWALLASWVPEEEARADAANAARGGHGASARRTRRHSHARADGTAVPGAAEGGAPGNGEHTLSVDRRWPPALDVPAQLDELPPEEVPECFRCPITLAIMREPAQSTSGITFERQAIFQWLSSHRHDPVTHAPLRRRHVSPNLCLRQLMEAWVAEKATQLRLRGQLDPPPPDKKSV